MLKQFIKTFLKNALAYALGFAILGIWFIGFISIQVLVVIAIIYLILVSYETYKDAEKDLKRQHQQVVNQYDEDIKQLNNKLDLLLKDKEKLIESEELWKTSLIERSSGFPTLLRAIEEYEKNRDEELAKFLEHKKHRAVRSAEILREEAAKRREAKFQARNTQAIIEYYESIAPFLTDLKGDLIVAEEDKIFREYDDEEKEDPVVNYLTKEEYRQLSTEERNQTALDRFWMRPKSKWLLGRLYERYVGYLYEKDGYDVEYVGIFKGYEDLGRDLICQKGNEFIIVQCKNWARFRTIYEKHIFQFFGTVFQYKDANPKRRVRATFATTTQLSDLARRFASELNIELKENFKFDQSYPCIKCNINRVNGEKIYHLPFDQQYDNTKIEVKRGEFYCSKIEEAEKTGFRRAFRWRGSAETAGKKAS